MKYLFFLLTCLLTVVQQGLAQKPSYCDEMPSSYEEVTTRGGSPRAKLPKFSTQPVTEYKIQVAILKFTDPADYPFHSKLVARYRPCEEVWVIESRESFKSKEEAQRLQRELRNLGYESAYLVELVGYQ